MPAADDHEGVDDGEESLDDPELVAHLGPTEHRYERALRLGSEARAARRSRRPAGGRRRWADAEVARRSRRGRDGTRRTRRSRRRPGRRSADRRRWGRWPPPPDRSAGSRAARRREPTSASRDRTGSTLKAGSGAPCGRPRWLQAVTVAPWALSHSIVGRAARIRSSSVMRSPSRGTLKSARSSTRLPLRSPRSSSRGTPAATGWSLTRRRLRPGRPVGSSSPTRCRTSRRPSPGCPWSW